MNKKTIFLLPLDLKGKKQTRITPKFIRDVYNTETAPVLPEHLQKKKKNIFTVELNRLIGKISEKNKAAEAKTDIPVETELGATPLLPEIISEKVTETIVEIESVANETLPAEDENFILLNKIYAKEDSIENADRYLQAMFQSLGIQAYSFFYYEPHTFTYYPVLCQGLSDRARTNLLFQSHDKFLQNRFEGYIHLYFQPVLLNDVFFKKKLSPIEFSNYSSIVLKFLDAHSLSGLVAFFYDTNANPSPEDIESICEKIDKQIEPLVPFLNSYFESEVNAKLDSYDFLRKIIHSIHIQAKNFAGEFYFTKLRIENFLEVEDAVTKKKSLVRMIKNHLLEKEGIIEISHNEIILLTKENEVEKVVNYLSENVKTEFQFKMNTRKYPDYGKNLYLYF